MVIEVVDNITFKTENVVVKAETTRISSSFDGSMVVHLTGRRSFTAPPNAFSNPAHLQYPSIVPQLLPEISSRKAQV